MSKCKNCFSEIGNKSVCPICGEKVELRPETQFEKSEYVEEIPSPLTRRVVDKLDVIEQAKFSVVKVHVEYSDGNGAHGSGWCGAEDMIITNAHVVVSDKKVNNIICEFCKELNLKKNKIAMKAVYISTAEDIAILKPISGHLPEAVEVLYINDEDTRLGEEVFTIGNPLHYEFTCMTGTVANPDYNRKGKKGIYNSLQTTLTLNPGNSGGAVFNMYGEVVGMATYAETTKDVNDAILVTEAGPIAGTLVQAKEIAGYGFCVKGEAIIAAIESIDSK